MEGHDVGRVVDAHAVLAQGVLGDDDCELTSRQLREHDSPESEQVPAADQALEAPVVFHLHLGLAVEEEDMFLEAHDVLELLFADAATVISSMLPTSVLGSLTSAVAGMAVEPLRAFELGIALWALEDGDDGLVALLDDLLLDIFGETGLLLRYDLCRLLMDYLLRRLDYLRSIFFGCN